MNNKLSKAAEALVKEYGLLVDNDDPKNSDIFLSKRFNIITRQGIDKISAKANINIKYDVIVSTPFEVVLKGTYIKESRVIETFGEASIDLYQLDILSKSRSLDKEGEVSSQSFSDVSKSLLKKGNVMQNPPYLFAMAEKRANSRGILKITGFYDEGIYGQDEADDFNNFVNDKKFSKPIAKNDLHKYSSVTSEKLSNE